MILSRGRFSAGIDRSGFVDLAQVCSLEMLSTRVPYEEQTFAKYIAK